jgi:hypothetical protein
MPHDHHLSIRSDVGDNRRSRQRRQAAKMDKFKKLVIAWLQNKSLDHAHGYVQRGRRFSAMPTEELKQRWVATFKAYVADVQLPRLKADMDDLEAELNVRKETPPFDLVGVELEALIAMASAAAERLQKDPARHKEVDHEFMEQIADFYQHTKTKPSN